MARQTILVGSGFPKSGFPRNSIRGTVWVFSLKDFHRKESLFRGGPPYKEIPPFGERCKNGADYGVRSRLKKKGLW